MKFIFLILIWMTESAKKLKLGSKWFNVRTNFVCQYFIVIVIYFVAVSKG